jgi:hypothetical protein
MTTVETALLYLSGRCDGASSQDNRGFNGGDSKFGKSLASRIADGYSLTQNQITAAFKMLQKYRGQLASGGILLPDREPIAARVLVTPVSKSGSGSDTGIRTGPRLRTGQTMTLDRPVSILVEQPLSPPIPQYRLVLEGDRVQLFSPYDPSGVFQSAARSIKGEWEKELKYWSFPDTDLERVLSVFNAYPWYLDPNVTAKVEYLRLAKTEAGKQKIATANAKSQVICDLVKVAKLDQPLKNGWILRDYQREGAEWLLTHTCMGMYVGGILADDMGTGKTIQSLTAAYAMQQVTGCAVLVICPVSLTENWYREAGYVGVEIECFSWAKVPPPLTSKKFIVVADESHALQSTTSQRTKKFVALTSTDNCLARWLLTGTPMKNGRPLNLLPLLEIVKHPLVANKWDFLRRYCNARQKSVGSNKFWDFTGSSYLQELSEQTTDIILRRIKKDVMSELPPKQRINVGADLTEAQHKAYKKEIEMAVNEYRERAAAGEVDPDSEALVTLNILRKTGSIAKVPSVIERAEELLESGQQVVIFTEFLESAHALHQALGGELLTGATKDRQGLVDRFQAGESKVFVGTIKAGGVGITLTAASNLILVDRPWTPGDCHQAEDRIHRLSQKNASIIYWVQLGEIDRAIDSLIHEKTERIELVLKGKRKTLRGLKNPKDLAKELLLLL